MQRLTPLLVVFTLACGSSSPVSLDGGADAAAGTSGDGSLANTTPDAPGAETSPADTGLGGQTGAEAGLSNDVNAHFDEATLVASPTAFSFAVTPVGVAS